MTKWREGLQRLRGKTKRTLAGVLTAAMCLNMVQVGAWAAGKKSDAQIGQYQKYGNTEQWGGEYLDEGADPIKYTGMNNAISMSKTIAGTDEENVFNITLNVTTKEQLEEVELSPDAAVVLVIDKSGSMNWCAECGEEDWHAESCDYFKDNRIKEGQCEIGFVGLILGRRCDICKEGYWDGAGTHAKTCSRYQDNSVQTEQTRLSTVKQALVKVGGFLDNFAKDAGEAKRWVSVVSFNDGVRTDCGWKDIAHGGKDDVIAAINGITAEDGTYPNKGLDQARTQLSKKPDVKSRFVILLSDGTPSNNESLTENSAKTLKQNQKATLYTVSYALAEGPRKWLAEKVASPNSALDATNGDEITISFETIVQQIKSLLQAWQVIDPMGDFITYKRLIGNNTSTRPVEYDEGTKTLTWDLWQETPTKKDGIYTYTLTYQVELDTSDPAFQEKETVTDAEGNETEQDKFYPTNKATRLTFAENLTTVQNGQTIINPDADFGEDYFNVPTVKGTIPEYEYTVNYYLQDDEDGTETHNGKTYSLDTSTEPMKAKLHSIVNPPAGYDQDREKDGAPYKYVDGAQAITIKKDGNVINLYYDRIQTTVTINYFYKEIVTHADGTQEIREYPAVPDQTVSASGTFYVNDEYTAPITENRTFNEKVYTYDAENADNVTIIPCLGVGRNAVNLYYMREVDERDPASVIVYHRLTDYDWVLENGKYVEKVVKTDTLEVEKKDGLKANAPYTTDKTTHAGYVAEDDNNPSIVLSAGENTIYLDFVKHTDNRQAATLTVKRHYVHIENVVENGKLTTKRNEADANDETINCYIDETIEINDEGHEIFNGVTYERDGEANISVTIDEAAEEVKINYHVKTWPETTQVKVIHTFWDVQKTHNYTQTDEVDETGAYVITDDVVVVYKENEKMYTTETFGDDEGEVLYAGVTYTATPMEDTGYTCVTDPEYWSAEVAADGNTEIVLRYEKEPDLENQEGARISVQHIYTTIQKMVVDGEPKDVPIEDGSFVSTAYEGWEGETFTPTPENTYNDNEYTLIEEDMDKLTPVELQNGDNEVITLHYVRTVDTLKPAEYTVNYIYNVYNMYVNEQGEAVYPEEPDNVTNGNPSNGSGWVNGKVTITDGSENIPADEKDLWNLVQSHDKTQYLKDGENVWTFIWEKRIPLSTAKVTVDHAYTTITIAEDGTKTTSTEIVHGEAQDQELYVGTNFGAAYNADNVGEDKFTYKGYTIQTGAEAQEHSDTQVSFQVGPADSSTVITFKYEKTVDLRHKTTYTVQHIYRTLDAEGKVINIVGADEKDKTEYSGFVGETVAVKANPADYNLVDATVNEENLGEPDPETGSYRVTLTGGDEIVFVYEMIVETRKPTSVKVTHQYQVRDTYTNTVTPEGSTEQVFQTEYKDGIIDNDVFEGAEFTTVPVLKHDEKEYKQISVEPSLTITLNAEGNVITIVYEREISTKPTEPDPGPTPPQPVTYSYKVVHEYRTYNTETKEWATDGSKDGEGGQAAEGAVISAEGIAKVNDFEEKTYTFNAEESTKSITVSADENQNIITLVYTREFTPEPVPTVSPSESPEPTRTPVDDDDDDDEPRPTATPTPTPVPSQDPTPVTPEPPVEELDETDVPMSGLPEQDPALPVDKSDWEDLEDEDVPLAQVPATGDDLKLWLSAALASGMGMLWMGLRRRKREDI